MADDLLDYTADSAVLGKKVVGHLKRKPQVQSVGTESRLSLL
ncbi:MAG: hypothetical protein P8Y74_17745 [Desulfobacterales bacterium]